MFDEVAGFARPVVRDFEHGESGGTPRFHANAAADGHAFDGLAQHVGDGGAHAIDVEQQRRKIGRQFLQQANASAHERLSRRAQHVLHEFVQALDAQPQRFARQDSSGEPTMRSRRSASRITISRYSRCGLFSGSSRCTRRANAPIEASGLRASSATRTAISPSEASRSSRATARLKLSAAQFRALQAPEALRLVHHQREQVGEDVERAISNSS